MCTYCCGVGLMGLWCDCFGFGCGLDYVWHVRLCVVVVVELLFCVVCLDCMCVVCVLMLLCVVCLLCVM